MANTQNNTIPSPLTRRAAIAVAAVSALVPTTAFSSAPTSNATSDPVLSLWRDWEEQYAEAIAWSDKWQKLERLLFRTVGFPCVSVPNPDDEGTVFDVADHEMIDRLLCGVPRSRSLRRQLHAELEAHRARWDSAAAAVQFQAVEARRNDAYARADALAEAIFETPANSFAGLAAKLSLIMRTGDEMGGGAEFPWRQIHRVLTDVRRLGGLPTYSE